MSKKNKPGSQTKKNSNSAKKTSGKKNSAKRIKNKKKIAQKKADLGSRGSKVAKKKKSGLSKKLKKNRILEKAKKITLETIRVLQEEDSTASLVMKRIREALAPTHFSLKNFSEAHKKHSEFKKSGGGHYSVHVVSEVFEGLDLRSRQQWVLNLLKDQIGKTVHAIQMELRAPSEVPLLKDSGAPLRRDLKVRLDRPNIPTRGRSTDDLKDFEDDE